MNQQDIWGMMMGGGQDQQAGAGAYPTFQNPYGIGSGTFGATPGASNVGPSGPLQTSVPPLLGTPQNVGTQAPAANQSPANSSQSYNPWDLKGQANSREF